MRLRHRRLRPIDDIRNQRRTVRQRDVLAIDVARFLLIDQEKVTLAGAAANVNVLANLDETVRTEHRQPAVTPGCQATWRKPIDTDVARPFAAAKTHTTKSLEGWG